MSDKINIKRRKKAKKSIFNRRIIILFLLVFLIYFFLSSAIFCLKGIMIYGIKQIKPEEILRDIKIKPRKNIFLIKSKSMENTLGKHPKIKEVKVRKKYPNNLEISIKERKPLMVLKDRNIFAIIDKEGQIMETGNYFPNLFLPLVEGIVLIEPAAGKNILDDKIRACSAAISAEGKIYPHKIVRFNFEGRKIKLFTSYNLEVRLGKVKNTSEVEKIIEKMERLAWVLKKSNEKGILLEYVDLSSLENIAAQPKKNI